MVGLLLVACTVLLPGGIELTVTTLDGDELLWGAVLEPGERFTLRYIHSVDHEPIWEVHSVDERGAIFIEEERFVMVGAGMGDLPGRGRWTGADGLQSIRDMHYRLGEFVLRIGSTGVDHTILWRGTESNLSERAAGQAARVSARPVHGLYRAWKHLVPRRGLPASGGGE